MAARISASTWWKEPSRTGRRIAEYVDRSLMLVTALSPVIGYDKAAHLAHYAMDHDLTLKEAALQLGYVSEEEFDRVVDPSKDAGTDRGEEGEVGNADFARWLRVFL